MSNNDLPEIDETERADGPEITLTDDTTEDSMDEILSMTRREMLAGSAGVGLGLGSLGMSTGHTRAETAAKAGTTTTVSAGQLELGVKDTSAGIHLQSLYDRLGDRELLAEQPGPLWKISMYDPDTDYTSGRRGVLRADQRWQKPKSVDKLEQLNSRGMGGP